MTEDSKAYEIRDLPDGLRQLILHTRQAVGERLELCSVVFYNDADPQFAASGTLIRYQGRGWIATAKHVAEAPLFRRHGRIAWADAGRAIECHTAAIADVVEATAVAPSGADVAACLLHPETDAALHGRFFPGDQVDGHMAPRASDNLIYLIGCPSKLRERLRQQHELPDAQITMLFGTHIVNGCASRLHTKQGMATATGGPGEREPELDYHVHWERASTWNEPATPLFPAGGVSGGGVWDVGLAVSESSELWHVGAVRMLGIAWYQDRTRNCVRAVPAGEFFLAADRCLRARS